MKTHLLVVALALSTGVASAVLAYPALTKEPPRGANCDELPVALREGSGLIRFRIQNDGPGTSATACVIDSRLRVIAREHVQLAADAVTLVDVYVPVGVHWVQLDHAAGTGRSRSILLLCPHRADQANFQVEPFGGGGDGGRCINPADRASAPLVVPLQEVATSPVGSALAVGAVAALGTALAIRFRAGIHFAALLLFSRLSRSRLLDQRTRAEIHELVRAEPGIHANAIANRLELAQGVALHHLHVLSRERLLVRMGNWGRRSFFAAGRYPPSTMRAIAALRSEPQARLFAAVRRRAPASLTDLAQESGMSLARASRLTRRLEEVGLVQRTQQGRQVWISQGPAATMLPRLDA